MVRRFAIGCILALAACGKGSDDTKKTAEPGPVDLNQRCEQLGKACGDNDKHSEKIVAGCKQAQVDKACTDKSVAAYDCYEKEVCGKGDKIWAFEDLRVLADRGGKCVAERDAVAACVKKSP
jgi:hypothetical protein